MKKTKLKFFTRINSIFAILILIFSVSSFAQEKEDWDFDIGEDSSSSQDENSSKAEAEEDTGKKKISTADVFQFFSSEQKVVIASKKEQSVSDAPATVYVVSQRQIEERGYQYLHQLLRDVPGMDFINDLGTYGMMAIQRGIDTPEVNKTLIFVDGMLTNNPSQGVSYMSYQFSLHNVKRVEILWGPASALYGANAYAGVINIVTKSAQNMQHTAEVGIGGVSFYRNATPDGFLVDGLIGLKLWGGKYPATLTTSASYINSANGPRLDRLESSYLGEDVDPADANYYSIPDANPIIGDYNIYSKFEWHGLTLGARIWHTFSKQGNFATYNASEQDLSYWGNQAQEFFARFSGKINKKLSSYSQLTYRQSQIPEDGSGAKFVGDYDRDDTALDYGQVLRYRREDFVISMDQQFNMDWTARASSILGLYGEWAHVSNWNTNGTVETPKKTDGVWGYEARHPEDSAGYFENGIVLDAGTRPVDKDEVYIDQYNIALYLQHIQKFSKKFTLHGGARYDYFMFKGDEGPEFVASQDYHEDYPAGEGLTDKYLDEEVAASKGYIRQKRNYFSANKVDFTQQAINPRAGLIFKANKDMTVKLLHGWAFRNPTVRERYSIGGSRIPAGESLKPEKIMTTELGFAWKITKKIYAEIDTFESEAQDIIQLAETEYHRPKKSGERALSRFTNAGKARLMGGELKLEYLILNKNNFRLGFNGNFSYQHNTYISVAEGAEKIKAHDTSKIETAEELAKLKEKGELPPTSNAMPRVSDIKANAGFTAYIYKNLIISPSMNYVGERPNVITNPIEKIDSYWIVNINIGYRNIIEGMDFNLYIFNLLDKDINDPGTRDASGSYYSPIRPEPGFTAWAKLSIKI